MQEIYRTRMVHLEETHPMLKKIFKNCLILRLVNILLVLVSWELISAMIGITTFCECFFFANWLWKCCSSFRNFKITPKIIKFANLQKNAKSAQVGTCKNQYQ